MADENVFLLYAVIMGIFITFVYDLLRIFRRVVPHNRFWVSLEDLGFWIYCAAEVFMLMYRESNGSLRWFAVLGAMVGMLAYKKTLSVLLVKYVSMALSKILSLLGKVLKFLFRPFAFVGKAAGKAAGKVSGKQKSLNNLLKKKLKLFFKMLKMVICKQ